jgi:RND family efflux transporter MFP subunit
MKLAWLIFLPMLVLAAHAQQNAPDKAELESDAVPISVTTIALSEILKRPIMRLSADAISLNHAQISAQATGEVLTVEVEVGDQIQKGATLVSLDCRQSELNQAAACDSLKLARKEFKRAQSLGKTRAIAEQQINQAESSLDQARIRLQQAAISVEKCLIKAPFAGVVTKRQIQLGAIANPGSPILELLQTDAIEVELQVNDSQLARLQNAEDINFVISDKRYALRLRSVLPLASSLSNKRSVRLQFIAQHPLVGSSGDVVWQLKTSVIPVDYIVQREDQLGYFIAKEEMARFVALQNAQMGHPAAVEDLASDPANIKLIVQGRYRVEDGSKIVILN